MELSSTIFDSKSEQRVFVRLERRFAEHCLLAPQVPLAKLFKPEPGELSGLEHEFLMKSNVDYTLCTKSGRPLMSIEFDGICGGFDLAGSYRPKRLLAEDPYRETKMDRKLRWAADCDYPLFVVSYDETDPFERRSQLTILDGFIGQFLASAHLAGLIADDLALLDETGGVMEPDELQECLQNIVLSGEVEAELAYDPLEQAIWETRERMPGEGWEVIWNSETLFDPPLPETDGNGNDFLFGYTAEDLERRITAMNNASRVGARVWGTDGAGRVVAERTVWARNVGGKWGVVMSVTEKAARLLALQELDSIFPTAR